MSWCLNVCLIMFLIFFSFGVITSFLGIYFCFYNISYFIDWEVVTLNSSGIYMTILLDWMSLLFMGFVFFISSMVIYYSDGYMEGDFYLVRFILLVMLFVISMMLLIISPNLISILLGWDGLGLISYLLVIYYQNFKSYSAGMLTVLSNRLGDVAFLMAIAWMLNFGSWNYLFYVDMMIVSLEAKIICSLMIFAAMTKSAQIPFSSWLPAAMAAPTPVSALVHSSTLVTAGVYLVIRFNPLLISSGFSSFLLLVGGATMFMSGLGANFEFDLKKIIALSTLSQLGLMMSVLSMGFPDLAFFHLLTHALFKALLFMCAGVIIHNKSMSYGQIAVFSMILFNNFMGLFPYIFTSTSHLTFTLTMALPLWVSFMTFGWLNHNQHMFAHLVPQGTPPALMPFMVCIETVSNVIRPGTLAVRLAANMIAGHLLMTLLGSTGPSLTYSIMSLLLVTQIALLTLESAVAIIQSYVFAVLSTLYSSEVN